MGRMTSTATDSHRSILRWAPPVLVAWAVGYGAVRAYWAAGHRPEFAPLPDDLVILPGWGAVGLCAAVGLLALGLGLTRRSRVLPVLAWLTAGVIAVACALVLLDVVGGVLFGLGIPLNPVSAASRFGMLGGAALLAVTATAYRRRARGACGRCGRVGAVAGTGEPVTAVERRPSVWAWVAAYVAVAGCLVRIAAQLVWGFDGFVYQGGAALIVFEVGFVLAGVLLPTALVHRFGLVWPGWVVPLAGRRVPRWLVLGPGFFVGGGLTVYFGIGLAQLTGELFTGTAAADGSGYGPAFMWIAIPAYFVWGVGVGVAAVARFRQTRPVCRRCGR